MIDETRGLSSAFVTEQFLRQNSVGGAESTQGNDRPQQTEQNQDSQVADTVTLSAEAVALAANVQPAIETNAVEQSESAAAVQQTGNQEEQRYSSIDIRV